MDLLPERAASLAREDFFGPLTPDEIATGYGRSIVERLLMKHHQDVIDQWRRDWDAVLTAYDAITLADSFPASERVLPHDA